MKLKNMVYSTGKYNDYEVSLTSNTSIVTMKNALSISMDADKKNWAFGHLTYKIIINNESNSMYENLLLTNIINTSLVEFVLDSVMINDLKSEYDYDNKVLSINIPNIEPNSTTIIKFRVQKKQNKFFILRNNTELHYNSMVLESNFVTVISPINKSSKDNFSCDYPHFKN